jgi:hypothetical protein
MTDTSTARAIGTALISSELQAWLARRLEEQLPDLVTRRFQPSTPS